MIVIGSSIADGAMAFLRAEYRVLSFFVVAVAIILGVANNNNPDSSVFIALSFLVGAVASGLAGFLGMRVATKSNNRTPNAARDNLEKALNVAFSGGSVMGLSVVGLGVLGLGGLFLLYTYMYGSDFEGIEYTSSVDIPNSGLNVEVGFKDYGSKSYEDQWFVNLTFNFSLSLIHI